MMMKHILFFVLQITIGVSLPVKSKLTLDEFFNATTYASLSLSPTGQHLLFQSTRPLWNSSSYENILWIYDIQQQSKRLITKNPHHLIPPQWSPSGKWIALFLDETPSRKVNRHRYRRALEDYPQSEQYLYLYSLESNDLLPIQMSKNIPLTLTWSENDFSFYLATFNLQFAIEEKLSNKPEWQDAIQYRETQKYEQSIIYRVDINEDNHLISAKRTIIQNTSFLIGQLLFIPSEEKLLLTSITSTIEDLRDFEIYSLDLRNTSSTVVKLTDNEMFERDLQLSIDGAHVLFTVNIYGSTEKNVSDTQTRLHSLNLINGQITRLAERFSGNIQEYRIKSDGSVYILGQLGTETQLYSLRSISEDLIEHRGWNGTYESITSSRQDFLAFIHSSNEKPIEIYFLNTIDQLPVAQAITNENSILSERDLPQTMIYQWKNEEDQQTIEGILHYPPGQFQAKNLPLLVLMHGGPYAASGNQFKPDWYTWAPLAASEGWLVLEPNYRGSTGYGDRFLSEIRHRPLSVPGKDILYGVDQLVRDGIADPYRLNVGGYSYGGFLTNWLITQTKRFNAALSGAGAIDHLSAWGVMDLPVLLSYLFGGYPWEVPYIYQNESPIYQLDRVRTPTLITTGETDVRVPTSQSYILERALHYRGVPVKLITFPNEGHDLLIDPWHGKIKVREELKWLKQHGNQG